MHVVCDVELTSFEAARTSDVGQRRMGDPGVFGSKGLRHDEKGDLTGRGVVRGNEGGERRVWRRGVRGRAFGTSRGPIVLISDCEAN